jgi:hypothetical protein
MRGLHRFRPPRYQGRPLTLQGGRGTKRTIGARATGGYGGAAESSTPVSWERSI